MAAITMSMAFLSPGRHTWPVPLCHLGMERQTGPGRPERRMTSMKAARAAASDGGYCVGRVDGFAGPEGPTQ
jgi:hypothetical protein